MGKPSGFMEYQRELPPERPVADRVHDYREFHEDWAEAQVRTQGARCMDCGVPFCHTGCPLGNLIPDWNDLVYRGKWRQALAELHATNNFPEFTGRLCPAPCEAACVLGITDPPVTIEEIEKTIVEHGFAHGFIEPQPPAVRTGKKVAVIGSGPAGLACAQQLNRAGHEVHVYERADRIGGLLRYGIPDFKMEKWVIDRRLAVMLDEGINFHTNAHVGVNVDAKELRRDFDALVVAGGATKPRDLPIPGRELEGVHFAMEFLPQQNREVAGDSDPGAGLPRIHAAGKHVLVIGGGDTGSDCIGTSRRHGALSVTNFELFPMPPEDRAPSTPWPYWPLKLRTSSSHDEGCERYFSILTKEFVGVDGHVRKAHTVQVEFVPDPDGGRPQMREVPNSDCYWDADLVLLAMGFLGPETNTMIDQLELELDPRGNVKADTYRTSQDGIFAAGDMRRGQSLIVWAISEGRECAASVDAYLMGQTELPHKGGVDLPRA